MKKEGEFTQNFETKDIDKEKYTSRILLHFFRHGEKASVPGKTNFEQLLTKKGKLQGYHKGLKGPEAAPTVGFGGYVKRAQEMTGVIMAGARRLEMTGDESLEELRKKLDEGLKFGSKLAIDKNLGFYYYKPDFCKPKDVAYEENRGLKFMVEESDELAEELGDKYSSTYSRSAGRVATILQKHISIAPRFNEIISDEEKKKRYGDVLERFMTSHASVIDVFLCKVVEKTKGIEERNKLMKVLGDDDGFGPAEGFDIEIDTLADQNEPIVRLKYVKEDDEGKEIFSFNEIIPPQLLQEIVDEGKLEEPEDWTKQ